MILEKPHAITTHGRELAPRRHWSVRLLPLQTLADAQALAKRFREVDGIRLYVNARLHLVLPAALLIVFISIACAIGVVVFLAERHAWLVLLGILLLPLALIGSLLVQAYVFFAWIEGRALTRELGRRHQAALGPAGRWLSRAGLDMRPYPPVPWLLATIFVILPLSLLALTWPALALVVIGLGMALPLAYARLDP